MTKLTQILFIGLTSMLVVTPLSGQDGVQKLKSIFQKYQKMEVMSMDIEAFAYASPSDLKGEKVMSGALRIDHNRYYSKMDGMEMIVVDEDMTLVRHKEKKIILGRSKSIKELKKEQAIFSLDSLLVKGGKITNMGQRSGNEIYQIEMTNSLIDKVELHIDSRGWLKQMTYYYAAIPDWESTHFKMDVLFSNISQQPPSKNYFDDKKFLVSRETQKPSKAYQEYTVKEVDYSIYQD